MSAILGTIAPGCSSIEQLGVERIEPAPAELAGVRRLGVAPFFGEGGEAVARLVLQRLGAHRDLRWIAAPLAAAPLAPGDEPGPAVLDLLRTLEADAVLLGEVERLAGHSAGPLVRVRTEIVRYDGSRAPGPAATVTVAADVAAVDSSALWSRAAEAVVAGLRPRSVAEEVAWEAADGWEDPARDRLLAGDVRGACAAMQEALAAASQAGAPPLTIAALYYDLALCQDLIGRLDAADRSYDRALTLHGSELHIEALRGFRARCRRAGVLR